MIRQLAPRPVRIGAALGGSALAAVAGVLALAGCATTTATNGEAEAPTSSATLEPSTSATAEADAGTSASTYADGTYTAEGSYATPESVETISVTVTLADDVVTAVQVTGSPQKRESERYQSQFIDGISAEVVGQDIDSLNVSRVAGSSLTSGGFNQAIDAIKADATA